MIRQRVLTRTIVGGGAREACGMIGAILILSTGDLWIGGALVAVSTVLLVMGTPSREEIEAAVRDATDLRGA